MASKALRINGRPQALAIALLAFFLAASGLPARPQEAPRPEGQVIQAALDSAANRFVQASQAFPEELYHYRPHEDARSFAEIVMHVASTNARVAFRALTDAAGREAAPPDVRQFRYLSKQQAIEKLQETFAAIRESTEQGWNAKLPPYWLYAIQHSSEHYGNLVTYYRANGLVPPASR
ncbi:MAG: DinB family protein [Terriglobia bacterium]